MNISDRIMKIIEHYHLTTASFAEEIDVQRSNISHIMSGRNKPSLDFLIKIKARFPELQWDWLIFGNGAMVENKELKAPSTPPDLFSIIDDENFGKQEESNPEKQALPKPATDTPGLRKNATADSQELQNKNAQIATVPTAKPSIKRIVWFYDNGSFESFEP